MLSTCAARLDGRKTTAAILERLRNLSSHPNGYIIILDATIRDMIQTKLGVRGRNAVRDAVYRFNCAMETMYAGAPEWLRLSPAPAMHARGLHWASRGEARYSVVDWGDAPHHEDVTFAVKSVQDLRSAQYRLQSVFASMAFILGHNGGISHRYGRARSVDAGIPVAAANRAWEKLESEPESFRFITVSGQLVGYVSLWRLDLASAEAVLTATARCDGYVTSEPPVFIGAPSIPSQRYNAYFSSIRMLDGYRADARKRGQRCFVSAISSMLAEYATTRGEYFEDLFFYCSHADELGYFDRMSQQDRHCCWATEYKNVYQVRILPWQMPEKFDGRPQWKALEELYQRYTNRELPNQVSHGQQR